MDHIMAGADLSALNSLARNGWANQGVRKQTPAQEEAPPAETAKPKKATTAKDDGTSSRRMSNLGRFPIDANVPLPTALRRGQRAGYPYAELAVGESFFVTNRNYTVQNDIKGKLFVTREWSQDGIKGRRVWRVK